MPIAGVEIAFTIGGSGPPVLMLHGFPQNRFLWARVAPALAEHFTVVCADLRGYGDSAKPAGDAGNANYSFRALAADQLGLMQVLGFGHFHLVGHDRGARTGFRLARDEPDRLLSLTLMDIVPTDAMLLQVDRKVAHAYWHWYFLAQPTPFPERLIKSDPDFFYETCLVGWGASKLTDFDAEQLAEYRRCWRDPAMIQASCCDYRAAVAIDLEHDLADAERQVACPTRVLYGAGGAMAALFDIPSEWAKRCSAMQASALPGGHFFIDQHPDETAAVLKRFLLGQPA